ncbi:hypothetical protein ACQP3C_31180, partial [Escherichia coli]
QVQTEATRLLAHKRTAESISFILTMIIQKLQDTASQVYAADSEFARLDFLTPFSWAMNKYT